MQKTLTVLLIVCLLSVGTLSAQSFTLSSDSVTGTDHARRADFVLKTTVTNLSTTKTVNVKWKRYENSFDPSWLGNQICISGGNCFFYDVDTGTITIAANSSETFDAHFANDSATGSGYMRVRFYEEIDSAGSEKTAYFGANLTTYTSLATPLSNGSVSDIQIYPNPAKEFVIVKRPDLMNVSRIEVYNMLGLKVITQFAEPNDASSRIDLLDLQKGVYMIRIFDKNNNVILTKSISKIR